MAFIVTVFVLVVWVFGALLLHWKRKEYYRKNPWAWNNRMHGLLSFTDRQVYWMTNLWPLTLVAAILYILMSWLSMIIEIGRK